MASRNIRDLLGVDPDMFFDELLNAVQSCVADAMEDIENEILRSTKHSETQNALLKGFDTMHDQLIEQIDQNMFVFEQIAHETCFTIEQDAAKDVQRRRSTISHFYEEDLEVSEANLKIEIENLFEQVATVQERYIDAKNRCQELEQQRSLLQPSLDDIEQMEGSESFLEEMKHLFVSLQGWQQQNVEGEGQRDAFMIQQRCAKVPVEKSNVIGERIASCHSGQLQMELSKRKWAKIVGTTDLEAAMAAYPF